MAGERLILCEGPDDLSFWAGWLQARGCREARHRPDGRLLRPEEGWGFLDRAERFLRVQRCQDREGVLREARLKLGKAKQDPANLSALLVSVDDDTDPGAPPKRDGLLAWASGLVNSLDPAATAHGETWDLLGGALRFSVVSWRVVDPAPRGSPGKQTLERLVCASLCDAWPERGTAVDSWLESRPQPCSSSPKSFAWSYMAGWYPDARCDRFYRAVWDDERARPRLQARLEQIGAWSVVEGFVGA